MNIHDSVQIKRGPYIAMHGIIQSIAGSCVIVSITGIGDRLMNPNDLEIIK